MRRSQMVFLVFAFPALAGFALIDKHPPRSLFLSFIAYTLASILFLLLAWLMIIGFLMALLVRLCCDGTALPSPPHDDVIFV